MKKILVTTDLSVSSKAAMRFAIQLASQGDIALTFFT
jgi:nucleotide-binding universal stress UspA family protein